MSKYFFQKLSVGSTAQLQSEKETFEVVILIKLSAYLPSHCTYSLGPNVDILRGKNIKQLAQQNPCHTFKDNHLTVQVPELQALELHL